MKVIGSVGSDEKLKFIKEELGFDGGFNYKKERTGDALKRLLTELGKGGLDVYYDNVGGETLDAALAAMSNFGRIGLCSF
jgi:NADPH-dependent curcumin reductase CurA